MKIVKSMKPSKVVEENKNKKRSINKLGVEQVLDDIDFGRVTREARAERFISSRYKEEDD